MQSNITFDLISLNASNWQFIIIILRKCFLFMLSLLLCQFKRSLFFHRDGGANRCNVEFKIIDRSLLCLKKFLDCFLSIVLFVSSGLTYRFQFFLLSKSKLMFFVKEKLKNNWIIELVCKLMRWRKSCNEKWWRTEKKDLNRKNQISQNFDLKVLFFFYEESSFNIKKSEKYANFHSLSSSFAQQPMVCFLV